MIMDRKIFINRRKGNDRREDLDPCKDLNVDLYHRKRRKRTDRRSDRTLDEDYYAFQSSQENYDDFGEDSHYH